MVRAFGTDQPGEKQSIHVELQLDPVCLAAWSEGHRWRTLPEAQRGRGQSCGSAGRHKTALQFQTHAMEAV